jgi:hypothetical protein
MYSTASQILGTCGKLGNTTLSCISGEVEHVVNMHRQGTGFGELISLAKNSLLQISALRVATIVLLICLLLTLNDRL